MAVTNHWKFSIAPMMGRSDRHCRYFWRLLSSEARLYTEMITTGALIHGNSARLLKRNASDQPISLQLGGSNPKDLAKCSKLAEQKGFDEVNLNCGCPSNRVQSGEFGASLMLRPDRVVDCIDSMRTACSIPVTIKHRLGVDDMDSYEELENFVGLVSSAGCEVFIIHARKAWLSGLSPRENREIPPLNYPWIYRLKKEFPSLTIVLNGGITSMSEINTHLTHIDGVMLGRKAYEDPWFLAKVDSLLFKKTSSTKTRIEIIEKMIPYIKEEVSSGEKLNHITRHLVGLYKGEPGGRKFRRYLADYAHSKDADYKTLVEASVIAQKTLTNSPRYIRNSSIC